MSQKPQKRRPPGIRFLFENSLFLVAGTIAALIWANLDSTSYQNFVHFDLSRLFVDRQDEPHHEDPPTGAATEQHEEPQAEHQEEPQAEHQQGGAAGKAEHGDGEHGNGEHAAHGLTLHFLVNDLLMALFFAIAAKEVWESVLPGGALSNPRKAATPLMATLGGIVGPAGLYILGAWFYNESGWWGQPGQLGRGWAIPCATDIAFSYMISRLIFGNGHPAIAFLLLLAIADDAVGLLILAIAYPQHPIQPAWLLLCAAAILLAFCFRKLRLHSFWWYLLIPGALSWFSFYFAGIHAALGLVPIIPCIPHAHTDLGIFAREELQRHDTLNEFEHWWKNPVELILGLFGMVNAGVVLGSAGLGTWLVLFGLLVGKPLGITLFTWISEKLFRLEVPAGMNYRHVISLGMVAGIGFTVALFVSEAAYPVGQFPPDVRDSVKMGALGSFVAAVVAFVGARMLGVRPQTPAQDHAPSSGDQADPVMGEP